jgi:hypothetical protein
MALALEPFHRNIPKEDLFANLAAVWKSLGRQPKFRDLSRGCSKYSASTYATRFGTWRKALAEFITWANSAKDKCPICGMKRLAGA